MNALIAGEIDMIQQPPFDLMPLLEGSKGVKIVDLNPLGTHFAFRFNTLHKPFDDPRIRQAALYALSQKDSLAAASAIRSTRRSARRCSAAARPACDAEGRQADHADFEKSKALLTAAGYDGTPVVLLQSTTPPVLTAPVAKALLERGGFKVDMVSTDWQTVLSRRAKKDPAAGGWSAFTTTLATRHSRPGRVVLHRGGLRESVDRLAVRPEKIEKLRDDFASTDPAKRKELAEALQVRALETAQYAWLGMWNGRAPRAPTSRAG